MQGGRVSTSTQPSLEDLTLGTMLIQCRALLRYNIALLYLQQASYDLDLAVETYLADDKWEKEHPMEGSSKGKTSQKPGRRKVGMGTGLSGQL